MDDPDLGPAPPDAGPASAAAAKELPELDVVTRDLAGVEAALRRLDEGSYGRCVVCDVDIDDDDLARDPAGVVCSAHLDVIDR